MTNKLVVVNSLKVPKIEKILLYEIKFIVPNYGCLQDPWIGGYAPRSPFSLSSVLNWIRWNPPKKFLGTPLNGEVCLLRGSSCIFNLNEAIQLCYISSIDKYTDIPPNRNIHLLNSVILIYLDDSVHS